MANMSRQRVYAHVKQDRFIMDNSESATNWSGSTDVSALTTSVNHREGTLALSFAKSGVTQSYGQISRTLVSAETINLSEYLDGVLGYWINLSDLTNIANVQLIIGENATDNYVYQTADTALTTGWNKLEVDINTPTSTGGNGAAWSSINYIALKVNFDANGNTLTAILLDTVYVKYSITSKTEITSVTGLGLATSTLQTSGGQKTQIVDGSGNVIGATANAMDVNIKSGSSSGTQYTEGDVDATITGTAIMMEVAANTLQPLQGTLADGLLVNLGANNDISGTVTANLGTIGDVATQTTLAAVLVDTTAIKGHVDGVEGLLTTIDGDTGSIDSKLGTLGQKNMAGSAPVVLASDQAAIPVTASAGTNLNTSLLALEAGGNLAGVKSDTLIMAGWDNGASDGASVSGDVAHDAVDAGEPVKIGVKAFDPATPQTAVAANKRTNLMGDLNGRLIIYLGSLLFGEDSTEGLIGVAEKLTATSTYMPSNDTSAAAEASSVSKASTGNLFGFTATNSSGSARYWQMFNSTTVPGNGTVPALSYLVASGGTTSEPDLKKHFSTGMSWAWSSTAATLTIGSTDGIADVRYK